ncbi:MAG: metalloregulator ArsR/SmtB family transcription factor [Sphaerochaeta sp.]|nr:metalloregulator ArsR/SmtB family transcription factor [Sphaerochaeta sp.]
MNNQEKEHLIKDLEGKYHTYAEYLKVLAHPIRLAIIDALKEGTCCVSDVTELLQVSQPNISQHLAILRLHGIVEYEEDGKKRCYSLCNPSSSLAILATLGKHLS